MINDFNMSWRQTNFRNKKIKYISNSIKDKNYDIGISFLRDNSNLLF